MQSALETKRDGKKNKYRNPDNQNTKQKWPSQYFKEKGIKIHIAAMHKTKTTPTNLKQQFHTIFYFPFYLKLINYKTKISFYSNF